MYTSALYGCGIGIYSITAVKGLKRSLTCFVKPTVMPSRVDVQLNSTMRLISGTLRSIPLPGLPVLFNIEPPALRRKAAAVKLVENIVKHDSWPIQPDILSPPLLRLTSRKLLWLDLQPVDI